MKDLPAFQRRRFDQVHKYISRVLTNPRQASTTRLVKLLTYDDGHYRAIFRGDYFVLQEGATGPTKSQWSTLKKHMKRIAPEVFIFKEHGEIPCGPEVRDPSVRCYYIDFGFMHRE
ncbi:MAG: hypothetical protein DIU68_001340 [Chloroflexota bacterium]|nr:MAG: hypothetical protein DIU68_08960 [Chloroflexota bacterium]